MTNTASKAFNTHLKDMCNDILSIYPNNWEIKKAYHTIELLQKTKPSLIISFWKDFSINHKAEIDKEGVIFFMEYDYTNDETLKNQKVLIDALNQFKICVNKMNDENKNKVLEYISNLTKISELY